MYVCMLVLLIGTHAVILQGICFDLYSSMEFLENVIKFILCADDLQL